MDPISAYLASLGLPVDTARGVATNLLQPQHGPAPLTADLHQAVANILSDAAGGAKKIVDDLPARLEQQRKSDSYPKKYSPEWRAALAKDQATYQNMKRNGTLDVGDLPPGATRGRLHGPDAISGVGAFSDPDLSKVRSVNQAADQVRRKEEVNQDLPARAALAGAFSRMYGSY